MLSWNEHADDCDVAGLERAKRGIEMMVSRRSFIRAAATGAAVLVSHRVILTAKAAGPVLEVFKSPFCGCCGAWVGHMRDAGYEIHVTDLEDLEPIKEQLRVPADLASCHTGVVDGYVIEGHVPASDVARLLSLKPAAKSLAVPGMPVGSPGMEQGWRKDPYEVVLFSETNRSVFARY